MCKEVALSTDRFHIESRYWNGTSLQLKLMQGVFSNTNNINLFLMIFPAQASIAS